MNTAPSILDISTSPLDAPEEAEDRVPIFKPVPPRMLTPPETAEPSTDDTPDEIVTEPPTDPEPPTILTAPDPEEEPVDITMSPD